MLILSGGEPLLRDDLERLAERAAAGGAVVVVGTNGTRLTRSRIRSLKAAGVRGVAISIDSLDPAYHDRFRHGGGSLRETLAAVERLREEALDFVVQTTVTRGNRDQIEQAISALGYRRNAIAAAMKADLTNTVGFMVPSLSEFHSAVLEHLARSMRKAGRALLTYCHDADPAAAADALDFFVAHRVDCLVMDGRNDVDERILDIIGSGTPVIFYDNGWPGLPVDRVLVENRVASCLVNPRACHETDLTYRKTFAPKTIAVVGAGPAGLACATVAAERRHRVTLFDAADEIGGQFNYAGPNIGFVAQVVPRDFLPKPFPDPAAATDAELFEELAHPSAVHRLHAQRELLRRGRGAERTRGLVQYGTRWS